MNRDGSFEDLRNTANCFVELEKANKKIKELEEENKKLKEEKEELKLGLDEQRNTSALLVRRIIKAIEYIEKYCIDDEYYINLTKKEKNIIEVLKILKGSEENESN